MGALGEGTTYLSLFLLASLKIIPCLTMIVQKNPAFRVKSVDIGKTYSVMNGKSSINVAVTEPMVGFRFGQFVLTKKLGSAIHVKKTRKAQQKKSTK